MELSRDAAMRAQAAGPTRPWLHAFARAFAETRVLWAVLAVYIAAAVATSLWFSVSLLDYVVGYLPVLAGFAQIGACLGLLAMLVRLGFVERAPNPARRMVEEIRRVASPHIAARALVLFAAIVTLQAIYAFFKPLIPRFVPYSWDPVFAALDRLIFLGNDAWTLLWPIFGNPVATWTINVIYHLWFFWMLLVWVVIAFSTRHRTQNVRFFLAEILVWSVGGTALAIVFSAVGPCYYGKFDFGPDPFAAQLDGLLVLNNTLTVYALAVQEILWRGQMDPVPGVLAGISALPSMHVASAILRTRIAFVHDRRLGWLSVAATILIVIGSVHLAWHYFVDAIAAGIVATAAWYVAGLLLRRSRAA